MDKKIATRIYMFGYDFTKQGLYCIKSDKKNFDGLRFYKDKWIDDWPEEILFVFDGQEAEDFIVGGLHWKLVSEGVRQVCIQYNIQGIQFLPVKVKHNQTGEYIGPYWTINVFQSVKSLNWESIRKIDIFRISTMLYFSARTKILLEQANLLKGASLTPIPDRFLGSTIELDKNF